MHSFNLIPLLALGALAQTTVQPIFFAAPSETNAFAGSVVDVANGLTTYAVACTSGLVSCYTGATITITEGPSSFGIESKTVVAGQTASISETCKIDGTMSATCVVAASINADGVDTATTSTLTLGATDFHFHPVTITAGASKLGASGTAASATDNAGAPMMTGVRMGMGMAGAAVVGLAALL